MAHSTATKLRRDGRRRKKKDRSEAHDAVLDQFKFLVETVGVIADGPLNVPLLKAVCGLAEKVIDTVQSVRANRDDCNALAEQIHAHLAVIAQTYHPELRDGDSGLSTKAEPLRLHKHVVDLHETLDGVLADVKQLASRSKWKRVVFHESDKRKIADCQRRLQHTFAQFHMGATISMSLDIHSQRADIKNLEKSVSVHCSRILHNQTMMIIVISGLFG